MSKPAIYGALFQTLRMKFFRKLDVLLCLNFIEISWKNVLGSVNFLAFRSNLTKNSNKISSFWSARFWAIRALSLDSALIPQAKASHYFFLRTGWVVGSHQLHELALSPMSQGPPRWQPGHVRTPLRRCPSRLVCSTLETRSRLKRSAAKPGQAPGNRDAASAHICHYTHSTPS